MGTDRFKNKRSLIPPSKGVCGVYPFDETHRFGLLFGFFFLFIPSFSSFFFLVFLSPPFSVLVFYSSEGRSGVLSLFLTTSTYSLSPLLSLFPRFYSPAHTKQRPWWAMTALAFGFMSRGVFLYLTTVSTFISAFLSIFSYGPAFLLQVADASLVVPLSDIFFPENISIMQNLFLSSFNSLVSCFGCDLKMLFYIVDAKWQQAVKAPIQGQ